MDTTTIDTVYKNWTHKDPIVTQLPSVRVFLRAAGFLVYPETPRKALLFAAKNPKLGQILLEQRQKFPFCRHSASALALYLARTKREPLFLAWPLEESLWDALCQN